MKKNFIKWIVGLSAVTFAVAGLVACGPSTPDPDPGPGPDPDPTPHTHTYASLYSADANSHWYAATCEHTTEKDSVGSHSYDNGVCTVCGYDTLEEKQVDFLFDGDAVAGLSAYGRAKKVVEVVPTEHRAANEIKAFAFEEEESLAEITLSSSVVKIGREAFSGCTGLKKVTFASDSTVNTIEYAMFLNCTALEEVTLPKTVTSIKTGAFESCSSLEGITLPAGLTSLGEQAFGRCSALKEISLPAGIDVISHNTFQNCTALASVTFKSGVTYIGDNAFAHCTALTEIDLSGGELWYIGQKAFYDSGLVSVNVSLSGSDGTYLAEGAFAECKSLKSASILTSINRIYGELFSGCSALEQLRLPFIGSHREATTPAEGLFSTSFGFIFGTNKPADESKFTAAEQNGVTYYIPNSLKKVTVTDGTIAEGSFDGCSMLEEVFYALSVNVETGTFKDCTAAFTPM